MSYCTPPHARQLPITDFVGPSAVPSQESYIAPVPPNALKKKARYAPSAGPVPVPVVCPPYMKPRDLVKNLYPLVHMRQINPRKFTRDDCFKSNRTFPSSSVLSTSLPSRITFFSTSLPWPFSD